MQSPQTSEPQHPEVHIFQLSCKTLIEANHDFFEREKSVLNQTDFMISMTIGQDPLKYWLQDGIQEEQQPDASIKLQNRYCAVFLPENITKPFGKCCLTMGDYELSTLQFDVFHLERHLELSEMQFQERFGAFTETFSSKLSRRCKKFVLVTRYGKTIETE